MFSEFGYQDPDIITYTGLANFDFDQSPVRKYRVIVPFMASGLNFIFHPIFEMLQPNSFPGQDFSLGLSFLIVNSLLMALFGLVVFKLCRSAGASTQASAIGVAAILTCRWVAYIAGLPWVDSLYLLVIATSVLGLVSDNKTLLFLAILIGPWAKESFIFIAPIIFFYSRANKVQLLSIFALSGVLVFGFRFLFDHFNEVQPMIGLERDISHLDNIAPALSRLFSFHGIYELFSILGFWNLAFIALIRKGNRLALKSNNGYLALWFFIAVLVHAILSTELARMFYLFSPFLALWVSIIFDKEIVEKISMVRSTPN